MLSFMSFRKEIFFKNEITKRKEKKNCRIKNNESGRIKKEQFK